jgi:hypothetical protein
VESKSFKSVVEKCVALMKAAKSNLRDLETKLSKSPKLVGQLVKMHTEILGAFHQKQKNRWKKK